MEDLTNDKKKAVHKTRTKTRDISYVNPINKTLFKKYYKYIIFSIVLLLIVLFPFEIGSFIGNVIYELYTGFTHHFN